MLSYVCDAARQPALRRQWWEAGRLSPAAKSGNAACITAVSSQLAPNGNQIERTFVVEVDAAE